MGRTTADGIALRGSQKWLQTFVENHPEALNPRSLRPLTWVSPVRSDRFREYRDGPFLERIGLAHLTEPLADFWPIRGAVWDGLALAGEQPVLVEAKAHVAEFLSSPSGAVSEASKAQIAAALAQCKLGLKADDRSDWSRCFYQYANRLTHLWWLHQHGISAHLLFVNFVGDKDMGGPEDVAPWHAIEKAADYALGLPKTHPLSRFVHHVHPDVRTGA
ncbi:hypothetical protein [Pelagovum pacificum]|uniref:hypothetical protein n=1 Tax=Pelagovum pacificum TaxID=2588711 RepID=UPI0018E2BF56|nr:hypothetical protein [Pelagovum pacificum]